MDTWMGKSSDKIGEFQALGILNQCMETSMFPPGRRAARHLLESREKKADRPLNLYSRVILSADHPPCLLIRWPIFLIGLNPSPKKLYRVSGNRPNLKNWNHQAEQRLLSLSAAVAIWTYTPMSQTINLHANVAKHMQFLTKVWYNNMFQYVYVCLGQFDTTICLHIYIYIHIRYIYIHLIYIYIYISYIYINISYIFIYTSHIYI